MLSTYGAEAWMTTKTLSSRGATKSEIDARRRLSTIFGRLFTVIGHAATISAGEWITASGEWINDHTHGQQFKARFMRTSAADLQSTASRNTLVPG
jgi:hypothetical protein